MNFAHFNILLTLSSSKSDSFVVVVVVVVVVSVTAVVCCVISEKTTTRFDKLRQVIDVNGNEYGSKIRTLGNSVFERSYIGCSSFS